MGELKGEGMFKKSLVVLFMVLVTSFSFAGSNDWLIGDWMMTFDPDEDTKDKLTFSEGNEFMTQEVSTGRRLKGMYFVKRDEVIVSLVNGGRVVMKLNFTFDKEKKRLYYNPDNVPVAAYYTRVP